MPYAVITGATHGIGKAIAEIFLSNSFSVAVYARNESELSNLQREWSNLFPAAKILCIKADASKKNEIENFATEVEKHFPQVDVLINNAGIFFQGNLTDEPDGQFEETMNTNLYSAYYITRLLVSRMKEKRSGHIFNICSVASLKAYPNGGSYGVSKYALQGFSDNLRHELMPYKIKVTSVMPGATYSRSWAASGLPQERFMTTSDVAKMIWAAYDLSPQANVESILLRPLEGDI